MKSKLAKIIACTTLFASQLAYSAHDFADTTANRFKCRVVGVMDGDTIKCLTHDRQERKIRLAEIDAPEKGQPFGQKAKQRLSDLVFNRDIFVTFAKKDKYNRTIGEIYLIKDDEINQTAINYIMVQDGLAWAYERYNTDRAYITAQQQAKAEKKGLWSDPNPQNPEDYRRSKTTNWEW